MNSTWLTNDLKVANNKQHGLIDDFQLGKYFPLGPRLYFSIFLSVSAHKLTLVDERLDDGVTLDLVEVILLLYQVSEVLDSVRLAHN